MTQSSLFDPNQIYLTDVGAFTGSASAYGTFDQSGNVDQWNEARIYGAYRGYRGGFWGNGGAYSQSSADRLYNDPTIEDYSVGFRLASSVPEPSRAMLLLVGAGGLLMRRRR